MLAWPKRPAPSIVFPPRLHLNLVLVGDLNRKTHWTATDFTILNKLLRVGGWIDQYADPFATVWTVVKFFNQMQRHANPLGMY